MKALEKEIVAKLKTITNRSDLTLSDLMEWSSSEDIVRKNSEPGETVYYIPELGLWAAVKDA